MAAKQGRALPQLPNGVTFAQLASAAPIFAAIIAIFSVAQLIVATYVRRGTSIPTVIGMALTSVFLAFFGLLVTSLLSR